MKNILFTSLLLLISTTIVLADWNESDAAKYIQRPDLTGNGLAVFSRPPSLGGCGPWRDDFLCTETGPITSVHIWAVWQNDELPTDANGNPGPENVKFKVDFLKNVSKDPPYSGDVLWSEWIDNSQFTVREYTYVEDGKWWEGTGDEDELGWIVWQYNLNLEIPGIEPFLQRGTEASPQKYWLSIDPDPDFTFGLLSRDPADGHDGSNPLLPVDAFVPPYPDCDDIYQLEYPYTHPYADQPIDLSFVIVSDPGKLSLKWSQPPIESDPLSQTPEYCGWDEQSYTPYPGAEGLWKLAADDYRCLGTMPVTTVYWWGSYYGWDGNAQLLPTQPIGFHIGFWSNVPADPCGCDFSHPGKMLWKINAAPTRVISQEAGRDIYSGHPPDICYKHTLVLDDSEYFRQADYLEETSDDIFWLSIAAEYEHSDVTYPWGFKTRPWHWMDNAVSIVTEKPVDLGLTLDPTEITPIETLMGGFDVAFALGTDPNWVKWQQPFTGLRTWPHYEDVNSWAWEDREGNLDPSPLLQVCDDWLCRKRTPVTAIVWWGSYIGYKYIACKDVPASPSIKPDYFIIQIRSNELIGTVHVPATVLWEYRAYDYDQVLVGYDKHPLEDPAEPVFRYSVKLPKERWFHQRKVEDVYWLSIIAVYEERKPDYEWGWTNHSHSFGHYAVRGWWVDTANFDWQILEDQTGEGEDMSFMLFTDPTECSCCPEYNFDGVIDLTDLRTFANEWLWMGFPGGYNLSDLDCDGDADFEDYTILASQWLGSCP